ncbi:MAG: cellulase family glycosylhydrolase [Herpetosiphonaceae bacterium]|nr:cellulase family glycosylhydrolase [Herpetosiphonaceae bacterium]
MAAPSATITGLHVSGNQILNGAAQPLRLLGVNRSGTEYQCINNNGFFEGPSDAASVQAIAAWHTNAVRVPLNEDCWLAINGAPPAYSGTAYQTAISNYVSLLNQNGLIAILDLHWNAPGSTRSTGQQEMPDADHAPDFWSSVANTFKSNSAVVFDLYNEPHDVSWQCWRDGGLCAQTGSTTYNAAGMQSLVTTVRNTGATNLLMLGGLAYSNDLTQWLAYKPSDPQGNLVASWHVYNFNACSTTTCYDSQIAPVLQQVPLVAGEMGENDCAHGFIDSVMSWLDAHSASYLGWAWDVQDCSGFPALISDYNGTPTNFGVGLRDHLASLAGQQGSITVVSPLTLTPHLVAFGQTLTGQATIQNTGTASATLNEVIIAIRPPGGTNGGGPFNYDFGAQTNITLAPGESRTIQGSLTFTSSDPTGAWYGYLTYAGQDNVYHDQSNVPFALTATPGTFTLYDNAFANGFTDGTFNYSSRNPCDTTLYTSAPCSYAIAYTAFGGINFQTDAGFSTDPYVSLQWNVNPAGQPLRDFSVLFTDTSPNHNVIAQVTLSSRSVKARLGNGWVRVAVPLTQLNPSKIPISSIQLKNATGGNLATIHVDDVKFLTH